MTVKRYQGTMMDGMVERANGPWVEYNDYAAAVAERDELARGVVKWGPHHCTCPKWESKLTGECANGVLMYSQVRLPHLPGCPVALAERIVKEGKQ